MIRLKYFLPFLLLIVLQSNHLFGQAARSPFSSFGYGDYVGENLVNNQGMAGTGVSNPQLWYLNNQNPALLVFNRLTVFQAGLIGEDKRITSLTDKGQSRNGNLNYLTIGFPALRSSDGTVRWATSLGLSPYSIVNFNYTYTQPLNGIEVSYLDKAQGGFNQLFWANGIRLTPGLSIGLKTSFLFSSIQGEFTNLVNDPNQAIKYAVSLSEIQTVRGVKFTPGFSYRIDSIRNKYSFNLGATTEMGKKLNSDFEQILLRKSINGTILQADTSVSSSTKVVLPWRYTIGASFGKSDKWTVATDFTITSFGTSSVLITKDVTQVQNGYRWSLGAELTPDVRSASSYLKRVTYRIGGSTEQGSYLVNGNAVKDFGINFGLSFPVNRFSSIDVAFRSGKRGDKKLNGIEENYFKIYFGVTFNDQWFIKRKFD